MNKATKTGLALAAVGLGGWLLSRARQRPAYSFADKVVLVTGGSRGLGLVLARQAADQGARIALCARDRDELKRAAQSLVDRGASVAALPCDLTDRAQVQELIRGVHDALGPVDVLINNAGTIMVGPVQTMTLEDFQEAMQINFWGALYTILEVLPEMRRRQTGRIVNITSVGGKVSVPHLLPYGTSKFALVGLSEGLRAELAHEGIIVTTVVPGLMRTGSPRNAIFKSRHHEEYTWFVLSDSLPPGSMSAARAAAQILRGCRRGDAEVVLGLPAQFAVVFHGLFPGLTANLMGLINQLLPRPGGIGAGRALGKESETAWTRSWLTSLTRRAERENNEVAPAEQHNGSAQRPQ
jgi:NAD(P)-dependent dehydrogenase (short-subunit alcohol dehydrogenase family)